MSLSFITSIHDFNNQGGTAQVLGLSKNARYNKRRSSDLSNVNLLNDISSARVYNSSIVDATMILFKPPFSFLSSYPDFQGSFLQITNKEGSGSNFDVDQLSAHDFNNKTQSILLVGPNKDGFEFRLSFRDLFLEKWKTTLDTTLSGSRASRKGSPTLTWEMWPLNISHLNSDRMYLKIHQKLNIDIPFWPDYDASITYHIYLYLNGSGKLRGHVARWSYWVEGGIKSGSIADQLEPKVISGMNTLNDKLNDELAPYASITFKDLYYLPGDQTSSANTGVIQGSTTDDITIVLNL